MFVSTAGIHPYLTSPGYGFNTIWQGFRKLRHRSQTGTTTMRAITGSIIGLTLLASSGVAVATMISGTIEWPENGVRTQFYQEDIWQIISDITPDTKAGIKLLSRSDKKFVTKVGMYQKKITRLENMAEIRELNEKQANRLLKWEDRLLQSLNRRNLLDRLLLAGLNEPSEFVVNDQTDNGIYDNASRESQQEASVPEPSMLILLALGLFCLSIANGKRAYRPRT